MCGIAGIAGVRDHIALGTPALQRMADAMVHRGPDAGGTWIDERRRCALAHRRLSIIDLSEAGAQPMLSTDSPWVVSFNGEIYNFQGLREELQATGARFNGHSDTEVLLEALAQWGLDAIPRLDGMFAFAAFNRDSGELILARDPFGEKPLYYCDAPGGGIAFASELSALETLPWFEREVSAERIAEMLMFQYLGAPRTIYEHASKLPPGHWMRVSGDGHRRVHRYFEFAPGSSETTDAPLWEAADHLEELLADSLERRLISDVPLGALLSGGVDSATTCALIRRRLNRPLKTFSLGFRDAPESETDVAAAFAREIGSDHHELIVDARAIDFLRDFGQIIDEPNGDVSCFPTYVLSRLVREHVTVAVSGDGGDEMFGGYDRYLHTLDELNSRPLRPFGPEYYSGRILVMTDIEIRALLGEIPAGLAAHVATLRGSLDDRRAEMLSAMRWTDATNYLPGAVLAKVDRMSMQHSLEVRTPFLSTDVARFAESLPDRLLVGAGHGKLVLREVACRYLPRTLVDLPKKGFGLPSVGWGRTELMALAHDQLLTRSSFLGQALGRDRVRAFLERPYRVQPVWAMCALESWLRARQPVITGLPEHGRALVPRPRSVARSARWLTEDTLLLTDPEFIDAVGHPDADGATTTGRGVVRRAVSSLQQLAPLIEGEREATSTQMIDVPADDDVGRALVRAGIAVRGKRVVWLRSDALCTHHRPRMSLTRKKEAGVILSVGLATWSRRGMRFVSGATEIGKARALLVLNPFDDTTEMPVVAHDRPVSFARLGTGLRSRLGRRGADTGRAPADLPELASPIDPQRALVVTHSLPSGGAERQWTYLAAGLREQGVAAELVLTHEAAGAGAHYLPVARSLGVPVTQLADLGTGALIRGVAKEDICSRLAEEDAELGDLVMRLSVHSRNIRPATSFAQLDWTNVVAGLAGQRVRTPRVVLSFRNYNPDLVDEGNPSWMRSRYQSIVNSPSVVLTGNSEAGNRSYAEWLGLPDGVIREIGNAIVPGQIAVLRDDEARNDVREKLGIGDDVPMVLGVFRLDTEKRPDLFIEACARVRHSIADLQVLIAGVGPLEDEVRMYIRRQGMDDAVHLLGRRSDIAGLLAASDLLLLTSRYEGMPNVALEALALGVPVVGPPVGALPEIVHHGVTGLIVDDSAASLAGAVAEILGDKAVWAGRVCAGIPDLLEQHRVGPMVAAYQDAAASIPAP